MSVPDHLRASHDVIAIDTPIARTAAPAPILVRTTGGDTLELEQLAAILARLLDF